MLCHYIYILKVLIIRSLKVFVIDGLMLIIVMILMLKYKYRIHSRKCV